MTRFHDSRFQGVRLVCRLRRSAVSSVPGVPTGPAALQASQSERVDPNTEGEEHAAEKDPNTRVNSEGVTASEVKDKFFIVKSLTVEDLELSVKNGVWATQFHNEEALNKAFEVSQFCICLLSMLNSGCAVRR